MVRSYRYILALLLAGILAGVAFAGDYSDCTVLSQSSSEITFVYRPASLDWAKSDLGAYPEIANTALKHTDGQRPVPGRVVYVALPPGSESVDASIISLGAVARISPPATKAQSNLAAGLSVPTAPERLVDDGILTLHGVRIARLVLHPAIPVAVDGSVDFASEMTVQVRYDRAATSTVPVAANPRDPFTAILSQVLINPEDGLAWREVRASFANAAVDDESPFAGSSNWIAIRTRGDGVHTVTGSDLTLAGVSIGTIDPAQIRLFSGPGRQLSTKVSQPAPPFVEHAILWEGDDDTSFESTERFIFWADGLNRWDVDSLGRLIDVVNRYDRDNVYWLALTHDNPEPPKRIVTISAPPLGSAPDVFTGVVRARHEEENTFRITSSGISSYYTRYWRNQRRSVVTFFNTANVERDMPATLVFGTWAGASGDFFARLDINGVTTFPLAGVAKQGEDGSTISTFKLDAFDPSADYELFFDSLPSTPSSFWLDYYTVEYERSLDLSAGPLKFAGPDSLFEANLVIANAAPAQLWDITDPASPAVFTDPEVSGSTLRFGTARTLDSHRHVFYAFAPTAVRVPRSISPVALVDLHSPASGADYLAVGPRAFAQPTSDFLNYRAGTDGLLTRFVAIEDIYNSFSLGLQDPLAIRRFLKHTHDNWPGNVPVYCLLVGDGTNDFLNLTAANSVNYVPPYIVANDNAVTDDNYVYFSDAVLLDAEAGTQGEIFPDMLIGRWPVKTPGEIAAYTAKLKAYESPANVGTWRSRIMMVADDEFGDRAAGSVREDIFIRNSEATANAYIPRRFDVQKIYLTEYPFDNPSCYDPAATGCRKSAAKEAVIAGLNQGALVFDFQGHGNPDVFAHERIFEREFDIPRLTNVAAPAAFLAFSCSIGFFDEPESQGMGEELFRLPQGGAIAVFSATRLSGAIANSSFNDLLFDLVFQRGITGVGASLYISKLMRQYPLCISCNNDRGYALFGDPAMRLGEPTLRVNFASIDPDSLTALTPTQVQGTVVDTAGNLQSDFDGTLLVTVRDVPRERSYPVDENLSIDYELAGGTLYRGQVAITDGQFSFGFIVPKDIAYGQTGALIMGSAVSATQMANGALDSLRLAGSPAQIADTTGPTVVLQTNEGEVIADGFRLPEDAVITVLINDRSGINLTGSAGHRLEVFVDGSESPLADLTDAFVYDPGLADRGHAMFSANSLEFGPHQITVKAWDNANNSTAISYAVEVIAAEQDIDFALTEFLNYPNPFADATTFYFRATRAVREARIRLFTLAGRMIWETSAADGQTIWDGRDVDGDRVANGVYLAQIEATGEVLSEGGGLVDKKAYREMKVVVSR